jgi:hypothetical protein
MLKDDYDGLDVTQRDPGGGADVEDRDDHGLPLARAKTEGGQQRQSPVSSRSPLRWPTL